MSLVKIGKHYHLRINTVKGIRTVTTKATNRKDAERIVTMSKAKELEIAGKATRLTKEVVGRITGGGRLTVGEAILNYIEHLEKSAIRSPKTIANIRVMLLDWAASACVQPVCLLASVDESHVNCWVNSPCTTKASTRRLQLSSLRCFFAYCGERGWITENPAGRHRVAVNLGLLTHNQKEARVREPFDPIEVVALLAHCQGHNLLFWEFAICLSSDIGLRLGDICNLEYDCFKVAGRATVWTDKRDKRVSVPITVDIEDMLMMIPPKDEQYLWPEQRALNRNPHKRSLLSTQFARICQRVGIKGKSFHCLRHACLTRWKNEGKSLELIAKDAGHSSTKTSEGYIHV